ncbi:MAG: MFS transporter [Bifidobacteriaceae bacterium]|jgi:MFS family permease|nr:MFS transporter [Bifidobacteriaceae bacterium]
MPSPDQPAPPDQPTLPGRAAPPAAGDGSIPPPPRRLIPWMALTTLIVQGSLGAMTTVILPNQLSLIDEPRKVANLALVTSVSFAVAMVAQPVVGMLSDRTRSRIGRRAPWMLGGAALAALTLAAIGHLNTLAGVAACWVGVQVSFNAMLASASAIMPDRIPSRRRGTASALIGFGYMVGAAAGVAIAGQLAADLPLAYSAFGLAVLAGIGGFVVFNRDPTRAQTTPPLRLRRILAQFWVSPRRHPDFAWAFAARFAFTIGYYAVFTYNLYIMTDYLGLTLAEANSRVGLLTGAMVIGAIAAMLAGGIASDRIGRRKPFLYAASVFMAGGLAAPLIWPTFAGMLALAALFGVGFGLYQTCDAALMTEVLPNAQAAGKDLGILNLANAVPQAAAPALGGGLVLVSGGYTALFGAGIVIVALAAAVLWPIRSVR